MIDGIGLLAVLVVGVASIGGLAGWGLNRITWRAWSEAQAVEVSKAFVRVSFWMCLLKSIHLLIQADLFSFLLLLVFYLSLRIGLLGKSEPEYIL